MNFLPSNLFGDTWGRRKEKQVNVWIESNLWNGWHSHSMIAESHSAMEWSTLSKGCWTAHGWQCFCSILRQVNKHLTLNPQCLFTHSNASMYVCKYTHAHTPDTQEENKHIHYQADVTETTLNEHTVNKQINNKQTDKQPMCTIVCYMISVVSERCSRTLMTPTTSPPPTSPTHHLSHITPLTTLPTSPTPTSSLKVTIPQNWRRKGLYYQKQTKKLPVFWWNVQLSLKGETCYADTKEPVRAQTSTYATFS